MTVNSNWMLVLVLLCVKAADGKQSVSYKIIEDKALRNSQLDRSPIILVTEAGNTFEKCKEKCAETKGCKMIGQYYKHGSCYLFNITYSEIPNNNIYYKDNAKIGEKVCYNIIEGQVFSSYTWYSKLTDVKSVAECNRRCQDRGCSTIRYQSYKVWATWYTECYLYRSPIISLTAAGKPFEECKKKCTEMNDCKMVEKFDVVREPGYPGVNYANDDDICYFYNIAYNEVPKYKIRSKGGMKIAVKKTCE